jgi:hypothetical protein
MCQRLKNVRNTCVLLSNLPLPEGPGDRQSTSGNHIFAGSKYGSCCRSTAVLQIHLARGLLLEQWIHAGSSTTLYKHWMTLSGF